MAHLGNAEFQSCWPTTTRAGSPTRRRSTDVDQRLNRRPLLAHPAIRRRGVRGASLLDGLGARRLPTQWRANQDRGDLDACRRAPSAQRAVATSTPSPRTPPTASWTSSRSRVRRSSKPPRPDNRRPRTTTVARRRGRPQASRVPPPPNRRRLPDLSLLDRPANPLAGRVTSARSVWSTAIRHSGQW